LHARENRALALRRSVCFRSLLSDKVGEQKMAFRFGKYEFLGIT
jgi:hypothetical protein